MFGALQLLQALLAGSLVSKHPRWNRQNQQGCKGADVKRFWRRDSLFLALPCLMAVLHFEFLKHYESTGKAHAKVLQNLIYCWAWQEKKKAEEERAKELNELFAVAIKQPKVPVGAPFSNHIRAAMMLLLSPGLLRSSMQPAGVSCRNLGQHQLAWPESFMLIGPPLKTPSHIMMGCVGETDL